MSKKNQENLQDAVEVQAEKMPTVKMVRELDEGEQGPTEADVHKDEVENYASFGWRVE